MRKTTQQFYMCLHSLYDSMNNIFNQKMLILFVLIKTAIVSFFILVAIQLYNGMPREAHGQERVDNFIISEILDKQATEATEYDRGLQMILCQSKIEIICNDILDSKQYDMCLNKHKFKECEKIPFDNNKKQNFLKSYQTTLQDNNQRNAHLQNNIIKKYQHDIEYRDMVNKQENSIDMNEYKFVKTIFDNVKNTLQIDNDFSETLDTDNYILLLLDIAKLHISCLISEDDSETRPVSCILLQLMPLQALNTYSIINDYYNVTDTYIVEIILNDYLQSYKNKYGASSQALTMKDKTNKKNCYVAKLT